jgi:hypothetical protein
MKKPQASKTLNQENLVSSPYRLQQYKDLSNICYQIQYTFHGAACGNVLYNMSSEGRSMCYIGICIHLVNRNIECFKICLLYLFI